MFHSPLLGCFIASFLSIFLSECLLAKEAPLVVNPTLAPSSNAQLAWSNLPDLITRHHPELHRAAAIIGEARGRLQQSGRLANPQITIGSGKTNFGGEFDVNASLSQAFPITQRLQLEKQQSRYGVALAQWEWAERRRQLISEAQSTWIDCLAAADHWRLLASQVEDWQVWLADLKKAADLGEMPATSVTQAQLEITQLKFRQQEAQLAWQLKQMQLLTQLGLPQGTRAYSLGALPVSRQVNAAAVWQRRPDWLAKQFEIKAASTSISIEEAKRYADLTAQIETGFAREDLGQQGLEAQGRLGISLTIPLPLHQRNEGNITSAKAFQLRLQAEAESLRQRIELELLHSSTQWQLNKRQEQFLLNKLLPAARAQVEQFQQAFQSGQATWLEIRQARQQVLLLESQLIDVRRQAALAWVQRLKACASF